MNRELRHRIALVSFGFAICLATGAASLLLSVSLPPHGIVYGSAHTCTASVIENNDACYSRTRYEPMPGFKPRFVGVGDHPFFLRTIFIATADADGYYSISLPAGHYLIPGYFDGGPRELDVVAGKKVEADFQVWRLPQ